MTEKLPETDKIADEHTRSRLAPSPNPATNLLIADIVARGISSQFRKRVQKGVVSKTFDDEAKAKQVLDSRGLITSLGLYGVSRLAMRSPAGLGVVAGGLMVKALYDRGKDRQKRRRKKAK